MAFQKCFVGLLYWQGMLFRTKCCNRGPRVVIGNKVKIQNNVSVYKGVTLEDEVFYDPALMFTNANNPRLEIIRKYDYRKT